MTLEQFYLNTRGHSVSLGEYVEMICAIPKSDVRAYLFNKLAEELGDPDGT